MVLLLNRRDESTFLLLLCEGNYRSRSLLREVLTKRHYVLREKDRWMIELTRFRKGRVDSRSSRTKTGESMNGQRRLGLRKLANSRQGTKAKGSADGRRRVKTRDSADGRLRVGLRTRTRGTADSRLRTRTRGTADSRLRTRTKGSADSRLRTRIKEFGRRPTED